MSKLKKIERRIYTVEFRTTVTEDGLRMISGHAAVFDKWSADLGGFKEIVRPGAFTKTLEEADVRALFNHDPNFVLGRNKSGTLRVVEDKQGLAFEIDPPDTQQARDLVVLIDRGDIDSTSFGFRAVKDRWSNNMTERELIEVELRDISIATFPAYQYPSVQVRSLLDDIGVEIDGLDAALEKVKSGVELDDDDRGAISETIKRLSDYIPEPVPPDHSDAGDGPGIALGLMLKQLELVEKSL